MSHKLRSFVTGSLLLLSATVLSAAELSDGPPKLQYEKYRLANGLEVILSVDKRLPLVAVNLWYHVGPANERPGRTGFAHLFEHMMGQGSRHIGNDQMFALLDGAGATDYNATTGFDRTNYFETLPANELDLALWLESDRMGFLLDTLDQEKLTGQIDVVRNERRERIENAPYGLGEEEVFHQLFPRDHPYYADIIGSHADIESAKLQDVRDFFRHYYAPGNASLAIVGDIDVARTKAMVEKYFGSLPARELPEKREVKTPPITAERRATVTDKIELPRVYMAWLSAPAFKPGDAQADLLADILGGGKSSRLYKKLVYEMKIAQDVEAYQQSQALSSVFQITATAKPGVKPEQLEQAIDEQIAALQKDGPTQAELERARASQQTALIGSVETVGGLADTLNRYNQFVGTPGYLQADYARYSHITVGDEQALAKALLTRSGRVVVTVVPGPKVIHDVPRTQPDLKPTEAALPPDPASDWRAKPPAAGPAPAFKLPVPHRFKLANGLTVMLLEQHQLPLLSASLVVLRGSEANSPQLPGLAAFTASMLDEGTTSRSALQLADDVAQIGASLGTRSIMDFSSVSIESLRTHADRAFDLLSDVALHPTFSASELERVRNDRLTALLQQRDSPQATALRVMAQSLYGPRHPYGYTELGTEASLKSISRSDLEGFWKAGYTPGDSALLVSGDITPGELRRLAEKYFGKWSGKRSAVTVARPENHVGRRIEVVDKPGAPQTYLMVGDVGVPRSTPDYLPLQVMVNTLGGQASSRINMNLREAHGYTYGAYAFFVFRRGAGPFLALASVRTDATAASVSEIFTELNRIRDFEVSKPELERSRDAMTRSLPGLFETTGQSVGSLANLYAYGLPLDYYSDLPARIARVSAADVQRVARQYLHPEDMTVVAVGDAAQIAAPLAGLKLGPVDRLGAGGQPEADKAGPIAPQP